jgi:arylsulfatase A
MIYFKSLKTTSITCLMLFAFGVIIAQNSKPNVIVIYTDDQGAIDLGSYGASDIYTPNIDKLAKSGTRFTQAYVSAPVCVPSRASLLTGKYPQNAGLTGNTSAKIGSHGIRADQYTMAELFKDNGYNTGHIGKWHLGMSKESSPNAQGFDYSFGHLRGCIDNYSHYFYWSGPNVHDLYQNGKEVFYEGQYFPDLASDKAIEFVENKRNEPFFMYYAINMPHYPYQPTEKWRNYYKNVEKPRGDYAAFISTIDERIGFLMEKLKELKLLENTIIIYQSDNGYSTEERAFGGGGDSGPYRGAKFSLFEGGIRLPAMISWKGKLPKNQVNDEFLMNLDWMPTLAKMCELKMGDTKLDGMDMTTMIQNPGVASPRTAAFWKYGSQWIVRKGKWKLIGYPKDTSKKGKLDTDKDALFLSDLNVDVSEMKNLADTNPEIVKELIEDYISWEHGSEKDIPKKIAKIEHFGLTGSIKSNGLLHSKYSNIEVLLDGKQGFSDYSSGQWIGKERLPMEFIIDLKELKTINKIEIGYLHDPTHWIFRPKKIVVSYSTNGQIFKGLEILEPELESSLNNSKTGLLSLTTTQQCRYLKIKINGIGVCPKTHVGSDRPAWFFIDEIIIN